jgi:hypothetical protein
MPGRRRPEKLTSVVEGYSLCPVLALVYLSERVVLPDDLSVEVTSGGDCNIRVSSSDGLLYEVNFSNYLSLGQLYLQQKNVAGVENRMHRSPIGMAVLWAHGQGVDLSKGFDISVRRESGSIDYVIIRLRNSHYGSHYMILLDEKRGVVRGDPGE